MDIYGIIDNIMFSSDLLEAAKHLSTFVEIGLHEKNRKQIADLFKSVVSDLRLLNAVNRFGTPGFISNKDKSYIIFTNEKSVQQYLTLRIDLGLTPVKFFKHLSKLSQEILEDFTEPSGNQVSATFIENILKYLDDKIRFTERVYRKSVPTFILLNNSHRTLNSMTALTDNTDERSRQFIFLYHLRSGSEFNPEFVFLHELGHVVQNRYGSSNTPPESFCQLMKKESLEQMDSYELCDLFADLFASSIICDSPFSQYDIIDDAPLEDKMFMKDYFSKLII